MTPKESSASALSQLTVVGRSRVRVAATRRVVVVTLAVGATVSGSFRHGCGVCDGVRGEITGRGRANVKKMSTRSSFSQTTNNSKRRQPRGVSLAFLFRSGTQTIQK